MTSRTAAFLLLLIPHLVVHGSELPVIEVSALRVVPPAPGGTALADVLDTRLPLVLRSQGGTGGQSDMTVRGSSFSGSGLAIEGLALRHPQTEHFHAELPFPGLLFDAPRVLTGMERVRAAPGHAVGSVAMGLAPFRSGAELTLRYGERGRLGGDIFLGRAVNPEDEAPFGLAAWAGADRARGVNYADNHVERWYGGAAVEFEGGPHRGVLAGGVARKVFGARGYYGVTPAWGAEEALDDLMVLAHLHAATDNAGYRRLSAAWRRTHDRYTLFWDVAPDPFENRHTTQVGTVAVDGRCVVSDAWSVDWRAGMDAEHLDSSNLGDQSREQATATLLPQWSHGRVTLSAGLRAEVFSDHTPAWLPQAGLRYRPGAGHEVFTSLSSAVRRPSYTELNYDSPGSLGNAGLQPQQVGSLELGWRVGSAAGASASLTGFARDSRHTVDWIKSTGPDERWTATDVGTVRTYGLEAHGRQAWGPFTAGVTGTWIEKDTDAEAYASRYVLDYARHAVALSLAWQMNDSLYARLVQTARYHAETPARAERRYGYDARVQAGWCLAPGLELQMDINNLWDDDFGPYVDLPPATRRVWFTLRYTGRSNAK